jgi:hypothetical protein
VRWRSRMRLGRCWGEAMVIVRGRLLGLGEFESKPRDLGCDRGYRNLRFSKGIGRCRGWWGFFTEVEPSEEGEVGEEGADGVEEGIPWAGGAAGDEGLVDFVEAGVAGGDDEGGEAPRPAPADAGAANGAEKQNGEDEIFGEVGALANDVVDVGDLAVGEVREEPAQERLDEVAGVFLREKVGGHPEDESGPEEGGPPGAQPGGN